MSIFVFSDWKPPVLLDILLGLTWFSYDSEVRLSWSCNSLRARVSLVLYDNEIPLQVCSPFCLRGAPDLLPLLNHTHQVSLDQSNNHSLEFLGGGVVGGKETPGVRFCPHPPPPDQTFHMHLEVAWFLVSNLHKVAFLQVVCRTLLKPTKGGHSHGEPA